jgi:integrase
MAAFELLKANAKTRRLGCNFVFPSHAWTRIDQSHLIRAFRKALEKAKIENFRFHDLRHTFGSRLAQAGVDTFTIMKLMGHKDIRSTLRYMHHSMESLRRGVEAMERSGHILDTAGVFGGRGASEVLE